MGSPVPISFGTQSEPGTYGPDTGAHHINAFIERVEEGKSPFPIRSLPGLDSWATVTNGGACRGLLEVDGVLYGLFGQVFAKFDVNGTVTVIGGIPGLAPVSMARNDKPGGPQIAIANNGQKFVVENDILTAVTDADLPPANSVTFLNRKIIYGINDGRMFWSAVDEATSVSALDFVEAEGSPDAGVRVFAHLQRLFQFGSKSIEVFDDTDTTFQRAPGAVIPKGCQAAGSVAALDVDLFWLDNDGSVDVTQSGGGFRRVSTTAVENTIATTADQSAITAFTWFDEGNAFYEMSGPDWTWIYNRTTGRWFQGESYGLGRSRRQFQVDFAGKKIFGSSVNGTLYSLDRNGFDEAGENMVWTLRSPPIHAHPQQMVHDALYLDFVTGVGLNTADAHSERPEVMMRFSDDGGRTWSNQQTASLGRIGEYVERVAFWGLGATSRQGRTYELKVSSPVIRQLLSAQIEGDLIGI